MKGSGTRLPVTCTNHLPLVDDAPTHDAQGRSKIMLKGAPWVPQLMTLFSSTNTGGIYVSNRPSDSSGMVNKRQICAPLRTEPDDIVITSASIATAPQGQENQERHHRTRAYRYQSSRFQWVDRTIDPVHHKAGSRTVCCTPSPLQAGKPSSSP